MKFKFIGNEPMITVGIGPSNPGDIIEADDQSTIELLRKSSLYTEIKQERRKSVEDPLKQDKPNKEE